MKYYFNFSYLNLTIINFINNIIEFINLIKIFFHLII